MNITIRTLELNDRAEWEVLFSGYNEFYKEELTVDKANEVWKWLMDEKHVLSCTVAIDDNGKLCGLAHYMAWPAPIYGCDVCYLSDLFVAPEKRGQKIGKIIYEDLLAKTKENGWASLVLLTQEGNKVGRNLYEQYGSAADYVFYMSAV